MTEQIMNTRNKYLGQTCYVVGKGASLDVLDESDFGPGPIIVLNDAIAKVETLDLESDIYSMQKDGYCWTPRKGALIVHKAESEDVLPDYRPRYIFDNETDFKLSAHCFSAISVTAIVRLWGCRHVKFICFDGAINGDNREWFPDGIRDGWDGHGYQGKLHREYLRSLNDITWEFVMPGHTKEVFNSLIEDNVLVACPTYYGKKYALDAYVNSYNNFAYPYRGIFMVDNTGHDLKYYEHLKSLNIPCAHIPMDREWQTTFAMSWKRILQAAKEGGYRWIASIEADNICPPLTLDILLNIAGYCRAVHVAHSYDWHKISIENNTKEKDTCRLIGLGCNLILTELLDQIFSQPTWNIMAFEHEMYEYPMRHGMTTIEVHNLIDIRHLDSPKGAEFYQFAKESIPKLAVVK